MRLCYIVLDLGYMLGLDELHAHKFDSWVQSSQSVIEIHLHQIWSLKTNESML